MGMGDCEELTEAVIIAVDDARRVYIRDTLALVVILDETMKCHVEKSKEIRHAEKRLNIYPEDEMQTTSHREKDGRGG